MHDVPPGVLSREYHKHSAAKRAAMVVRLPDGSDFLLDSVRRRPEGGLYADGNGYGLTETDGKYTAKEILDNGRWRGYLLDGALVEEGAYLAEMKKKAEAAPRPNASKG